MIITDYNTKKYEIQKMSKSNTDTIDLEKELDKLIAELTTSVSVKKEKRIKESGKKY